MLTDIIEQADKEYSRTIQLIKDWPIEEQRRVLFSWMGINRLKEMNDFLESKLPNYQENI